MKKYQILLLLLLTIGTSISRAAEIIQIGPSTRNLLPHGKSKDAIDGDWIMKNDLVIVIIGNSVYGREANMRVQSIQGAVIDFTSLKDNNDYLAAFYPQGIPGPDSRKNPAVFADKIEVIRAEGAQIVLRAIRSASEKVPYESFTEYTLRDGERFLRVKTNYTNSSGQAVSITFADKLRMDMDIEKEVTPLGKSKLAFMFNKWFNAAYGIYSEKGLLLTEKPKLESDPATGLLVAFDDPKSGGTSTVTLAPGEKIEATRFLLYGKDVAELQRIVKQIEKSSTPLSTLKITDSNNKAIPGVFVEILNSNKELASFAISNSTGIAELPLSPGNYTYQATKVGHDTINGNFSATTKDAAVTLKMTVLSSVDISVKEAGSNRMLPVKVEFKGLNGTPDPFLGTTKRAEGTANLYYSIKNSFNIPVPAGKYMVTFSHGPEYNTVSKLLEIKTGETKAISAEIGRLFSSPQWVIADFHNHSSSSGDNDAETRSRIINLAGSGIEFGPATEHNRISSYTDDIKKMGLAPYLASAAGIELTGPTGVASGPNHQNAFALTIIEGKQGGGFPGISADLYTQLKGIYDYDKDKRAFIQHNHPGTEIPNLYFDKNRDGVIDNGYNTRQFTNAIELQTYVYDILKVTDEGAKDKKSPVFYWLQMLNQGDRIFATMTSDSHIIGERGGLRFVYVYSKKDDPAQIDQYDIAANAKKGRMVMSTGPFLKADINGFLPGDDLKSTAKGLKMNVEVYANNEIIIDRVQVLINGHQDKNLNFTTESHPQFFTNNSLQFKHSFPLVIEKDANVIVVATGKKKNAAAPISARNARGEVPVPMAITNPFFVDVNGDGFVPSKDTLGEPLPTAVRPAVVK